MPFLVTGSTLPAPSSPLSVTAPVVDDRRLELESLDATRVFTFDGVNCFVMEGVEGLDVPPRELTMSRSGQGVTRLDVVEDTTRDVFVPLFLSGADHLGLLRVLSRLRGFMDHRGVDYRWADGTFDLVAYTGGSGRRLRCAYKDGLGNTSSTLGDWVSVGLNLVAVWPFWRGVPWSTPVVRLPEAAPFLSNNPVNVWPRKLTRSTALGEAMPVTVGGDVPTAAVIELWGPTTTTTVSSPAGLSVVVSALGAGEHLRVDSGRNRDVALNGVSQSGWGKIARGARWDPLPPGGTTVTIEVTGATASSAAVVYGESLFESPWDERTPA